jgi:hypothetical protein
MWKNRAEWARNREIIEDHPLTVWLIRVGHSAPMEDKVQVKPKKQETNEFLSLNLSATFRGERKYRPIL